MNCILHHYTPASPAKDAGFGLVWFALQLNLSMVMLQSKVCSSYLVHLVDSCLVRMELPASALPLHLILCFIFSLQSTFALVGQWANVMNVFSLIAKVFCLWFPLQFVFHVFSVLWM